PTERAAETTAIDGHAEAVARGAGLDRAGELDFARRGVDDAEVDRDVGLLMLAAHADAVEAEAPATARDIVLERRDGGDDDVLRAGQFAELCTGRLRHTSRGGQVLLVEN